MLSKLIKGIVILLLAGLLALSLLWQRMIIVGLDLVLQGSGYQLDDIRFGAIGLSTADLPLVRLKGAAGEALEHLVLEGLVFQYDLQGLWFGRLNGVSARRVHLEFQANPVADESPVLMTELFQSLSLMPDMTRISQLSWSGVSGLADGQVSLQVDNTGTNFSVRVRDLNYPETQAQLTVKRGPVTALDFALTGNGEPLLWAQSQISLEPDKEGFRGHGGIHLQAAEIQALAARYMAQPYHGVRDASGELIINWSGSMGDDLGNLVRSADIVWDAKVRSAGSLVSPPLLKIQTNIPLSGKLRQGELVLVVPPGGAVDVDIGLEHELIAAARAEIRLGSPLQVKVGPLKSGSKMGLEMSGELVVSLRGGEHQIKLELDLLQLNCKPVVAMRCQARVTLAAVAQALQFSDYRLSGFRIALGGELDINQEGGSFLIGPGVQASLQKLSLAQAELRHVQLQSGGGELEFGFKRNEFALALALVDLSVDSVFYQGYQLTPAAKLTDVSARFDETLEIKADFAVGPWSIQHPEGWRPPVPEMSGQVVFQDARLDINAQLFGKLPEMGAQLNLQYWPDLKQSHLKFELWPVDWQGQDNKLATLFPGWPYPVGVVSGQIQAAGDLTLKWLAPGAPQVAGHLSAAVNNLSGFVEDIYFSGLTTDIVPQFHHGEASVIEVSGELQLETIDVGLPLTNLVLDYRAALDAELQRGTLQLAEFSADVLGGSLSMPSASFDLFGLNHRFELALHNLSLKQLVALGEYPGLELSGAIEGKLPVQVSHQGIRVEQGWLQAMPPGGVIRYQQAVPLTLGSVNPQLQLVRDVLQNFEYHSLKTAVNFNEQGELLLAVQVQGANPGVADGREIHLNLKLEENIADLLRSIKMGREFSEFIQGRFSRNR